MGTSYVEVIERIVDLLESLADEEIVIAVDTTGVCRPVADMLRARLGEWLNEDERARIDAAWITITGGDSVTKVEGGGLRVPKRDLARAPLVLMQNRQQEIAEGLELAPVLKRELLNFKVKINIATGHDSYEPGARATTTTCARRSDGLLGRGALLEKGRIPTETRTNRRRGAD